ncbi:hypothetical protein HanOQP8_Chr01g0006441 [Helianthus annuus]|nr:hypothetical protein HanOQP8_Chr01g0006441 [Helianthus annuus]
MIAYIHVSRILNPPLFSSHIITSIVTIYAGRQWIHVKSKIKKEYPSVQYASWTFWPVIGWINHRHVPLQFRVIVQSFVAMCW